MFPTYITTNLFIVFTTLVIANKISLFLKFKAIDACESNPCLNEAVCHTIVEGYYCTCADGYTGHNCDSGLLSVLASLAANKIIVTL